jgi:hypothetical protein
VLLVAGLAHAAPPKLAELTKAYAAEHGLPVRVVKNDLGTRVVERHFVPVLPTTHDSFVEHFQAKNGAVIWRGDYNQVHMTIGLAPDRALSWDSRSAAVEKMAHDRDGVYIALALDPAQVAHWEAFIDKYTPPGGRPYNLGKNDGYSNFVRAMHEKGEQAHGNCSWWVAHAEVAPGLNLATAMGVRRARGPDILAPRLVHAGNELVGPIGVPVNSIEEFNQMTDEQLMGPEPAGGAAEQVKP